MKRYWSGLLVAGVVAATAALGAQAQGQRPVSAPPADVNASPGVQEAPRAPAAQVRTQNSVTITGCLQNAPASAAQGRGSTTAQAGFLLANAQMTATGRPVEGAVGTAGARTDDSYRLEGDEKVISPHLNHQVRVTGTLQSSSAATTGAERSAPGSTASAATLKVESVEMVASTCPPAAATAPRTPPAEAAPSAKPAEPANPAVPAVPPDRK
jgi:hypothetical protein